MKTGSFTFAPPLSFSRLRPSRSRFLVSPKRFAQISATHTQEQIKSLGLVPVHPRFQVIALGLPVPRFEGNPLDPPLRSRFQARNVNALAADAQLSIIRHMYPNVDPSIVSKIVSFAEALNRMQALTSAGVQSQDDSLHIARMLALPPTAAVDAARLLGKFPNADIRDILTRVYPFEARPDETEVSAIRSALASLGLLLPLDMNGGAPGGIETIVHPSVNFQDTRIESAAPGAIPFVETDESANTLSSLAQDDAAGFDICIIGEQGSGKSRLIQRFAASRQRRWRTMQMYRDMTARDLLQRRATDENGDTVWINSPLVTAAIRGEICVLDGVHRLGPGTLSVLQQLVHDRQAQLCDGRLLSFENQSGDALKVVPIHPNFRVVALATPPTKIGRGQWLSSEICAMFHFHLLRDVSVAHKLAILNRLFPQMKIATAATAAPTASFSAHPMAFAVGSLVKFVRILEAARKKGAALAAAGAAQGGASPLGGSDSSELPKVSLRQLIRVCKRTNRYPEDLAEALEDTLLLRFLPSAVRDVVFQMLEHSGVLGMQQHQDRIYAENLDQLHITLSESSVNIGTDSNAIPSISMQRSIPKNPALIPKITFFEIPNHVRLLREMLKDLILEEHILLIGNQGVGKNILADCLLEMLRIEREYIQLHRDTTVQTLTLSPSIQSGVIVWEDSPLIRAVVHGRALVIDEADKAPLEVVCVLKGLIEDGEMLLSDGRRIMHPERLASEQQSENIIPIHPSFRMIVLANRPGYPFLGNNFFRECGDCFAVHVVNNPDAESELRLLKSYAPAVDLELLQRLINLFGDLREMVDRGVLTYPYSLRELVNISKHIQAFPGDSLAHAIDNVFHFDSYDTQLREHLAQVFHRHGVPLAAGDLFRFEVQLAEPRPLPPPTPTAVWQLGVSAAQPEDEMKSSVLQNPLVEKGRIQMEQKPMLPVRSRVQARIQSFTEERFQWRLDVAGHTESVAVTPDGHVCVLTSQPLQIVIFKPPYTQFRVVPLGDHLTTFVRTPESQSILASHSPTLASLPDNTLVLFVASFSMLIKIGTPPICPSLAVD